VSNVLCCTVSFCVGSRISVTIMYLPEGPHRDLNLILRGDRTSASVTANTDSGHHTPDPLSKPNSTQSSSPSLSQPELHYTILYSTLLNAALYYTALHCTTSQCSNTTRQMLRLIISIFEQKLRRVFLRLVHSDAGKQSLW
jgi:hypothetical protein